MDYKLNGDLFVGGFFAVPSKIVDEHIRMCGPLQLKVLLWYLRNQENDPTVEKAAAALKQEVSYIVDAIQYWTDSGVMVKYGETGAQPVARASDSAASLTENMPVKSNRVCRERVLPTRDEIVRIGSDNAELKYLLSEAEARFGKILSHNQQAVLTYLHADEGIPAAVLLMIIELALSDGKHSIKYIETVALDWLDNGIVTVEAAERKICDIAKSKSLWNRVCGLFDIPRRKPSKKEQEYVETWVDQWGFDDDMLTAAYDVCVNKKNTVSFSYINGILARAHKNGVSSADELNNGGNYGLANGKGAGTTFDIDEYERRAMIGPKLPDK